MNVCIIGTGYVGLTTGTCLAFLGHKVICLDSDEKKIASLQAGRTPIYEPFLTELIAEANGNLRFTSDYAEAIPDARVIFICGRHTTVAQRKSGPALSVRSGARHWTTL